MFHNFLKDNNVVKIDIFQIIHEYTVGFFKSSSQPKFLSCKQITSISNLLQMLSVSVFAVRDKISFILVSSLPTHNTWLMASIQMINSKGWINE